MLSLFVDMVFLSFSRREDRSFFCGRIEIGSTEGPRGIGILAARVVPGGYVVDMNLVGVAWGLFGGTFWQHAVI